MSGVPALLVGDFIGASKYFSDVTSLFPKWRVFAAAPKRGDIAVFKLPTDNSTDVVKRVIGLRGDHIQMGGGNLFINGKMVKRELIGENREDQGGGYDHVVKRYEETLPGGVTHLIQTWEDGAKFANNTNEFIVPPGKLFMMGDNRDDSADSREWGYVPFENLVGRVEVIFFSMKTKPSHPREMEAAWEIWRWPWTVHWNRLAMIAK